MWDELQRLTARSLLCIVSFHTAGGLEIVWSA
jgi:hypothetical protein